MKNHFTIPTGIEKRLQVWTDWAERQSHTQTAFRPYVTISREYGCQAYKLAEALYERLGKHAASGTEWSMLDRYLLETIAHESGYSKAELNYMTQASPGFQSMMANLSGPESASPAKAFTSIKDTIRYFAQTGNCINVGRGGACITQDLPNALHVRLVASLEFKVGHIMKSLGLTEQQAAEVIQTRQGERDAFIKHFTNMNTSDPKLYHLILNNEKSSITEMADMIYARVLTLIDA